MALGKDSYALAFLRQNRFHSYCQHAGEQLELTRVAMQVASDNLPKDLEIHFGNKKKRYSKEVLEHGSDLIKMSNGSTLSMAKGEQMFLEMAVDYLSNAEVEIPPKHEAGFQKFCRKYKIRDSLHVLTGVFDKHPDMKNKVAAFLSKHYGLNSKRYTFLKDRVELLHKFCKTVISVEDTVKDDLHNFKVLAKMASYILEVEETLAKFGYFVQSNAAFENPLKENTEVVIEVNSTNTSNSNLEVEVVCDTTNTDDDIHIVKVASGTTNKRPHVYKENNMNEGNSNNVKVFRLDSKVLQECKWTVGAAAGSNGLQSQPLLVCVADREEPQPGPSQSSSHSNWELDPVKKMKEGGGAIRHSYKKRKESYSPEIEYDSEGKILCPICSKTFDSKSTMMRHFRTYHCSGVSKFKCGAPHCSFDTFWKSNLKAHLTGHHQSNKTDPGATLSEEFLDTLDADWKKACLAAKKVFCTKNNLPYPYKE